ncbi:uncharacterized protein EI97DRAFT_435448 [Westerdykella ornata]|uniref:Uncharacterized protein n=1 Tax=Westerdykella ornata TaxID=318751 RepID=A0A6A6JCC6_WESOR|nr:uncharacterized protein EI97DRAFT_435448 [Westerdykella ornata]KAF2274082.1 hypothetical protein EI97DRAFT_435448 [Westerdykella ornata]
MELSDAPSGTESEGKESPHLHTKVLIIAKPTIHTAPSGTESEGEESPHLNAKAVIIAKPTVHTATSSDSFADLSLGLSGHAGGSNENDAIPPVLLERVKEKAANSNINIDELDLEGEDWFPEIPVNPNAPHKLIPVEARRKAVRGEKDTSLLTILVKNSQDGKLQELRYAKTPYFMIDWNSKRHIAGINSWRAQIWGRAGFKEKQIIKFTADEDDWFDLYYNLGLAKGLQSPIKLPGVMAVMDDFNRFFQGKVLTDKKGQALEPREPRSYSSFASKSTRIITAIKDANPGAFDERERQFRPVITDELLRSYQERKKKVDATNEGAVKAMFAALLFEHDKNHVEKTKSKSANGSEARAWLIEMQMSRQMPTATPDRMASWLHFGALSCPSLTLSRLLILSVAKSENVGFQ